MHHIIDGVLAAEWQAKLCALKEKPGCLFSALAMYLLYSSDILVFMRERV